MLRLLDMLLEAFQASVVLLFYIVNNTLNF